MKLIIYDFLRRWQWLYVGTFVVQLFLYIFGPPSISMFGLATIIYCGPVLLSFDLARGAARVCQSLPLTRRDLAASWRFLAMVVPAILFICNLLLASLCRGLFRLGGVAPLSLLLLWIVLGVLWLGVAFHILTLMSVTTPRDTIDKTKNNLIGAAWGACIGGGVLFLLKMPMAWKAFGPVHWLVLGGALLSTIIGWRRAEEMVISRSRPLLAFEAGAGAAADHEKAALLFSRGARGVPLLLGTLTWNTVRATGIVFIVFLFTQVYLSKNVGENWLDAAGRLAQQPLMSYILVPLVMIMGVPWITGLRHLRTLPLPGSILTLLVCGAFALPSFFAILFVGLLQTALGAHSFTTEWLSRTCFMMAPLLLAGGLLLRFGLSLTSYILLILPVLFGGPLTELISTHLAPSEQILLTITAWLFGALLIHYSITRRSEPYRNSFVWPMKLS